LMLLLRTVWGVGRATSLLLALPSAALALTGICPDGSVFIVQHEPQVPCKAAKEVEPGEVPPLRPQYLPNPYTWHVYNEVQDPNNPYNLIDSVRDIRALHGPGAAPGGATQEQSLPGAGGAWDEGTSTGPPTRSCATSTRSSSCRRSRRRRRSSGRPPTGAASCGWRSRTRSHSSSGCSRPGRAAAGSAPAR